MELKSLRKKQAQNNKFSMQPCIRTNLGMNIQMGRERATR